MAARYDYRKIDLTEPARTPMDSSDSYRGHSPARSSMSDAIASVSPGCEGCVLAR
jgi:hypothetical protein